MQIEGVIVPLSVCALLSVGSFALAFRGFSVEGLPLTRSVRMRGLSAKITGVACALLGLFFLWQCGILLWWAAAGVR
jgi:hypothetical protein